MIFMNTIYIKLFLIAIIVILSIAVTMLFVSYTKSVSNQPMIITYVEPINSTNIISFSSSTGQSTQSTP